MSSNFLHKNLSRDVILQTDLPFTRLGGMEAQKHGRLGAVLGVLMDTELDVLPKLLPELHVVNLFPHFDDLAHLGLQLGECCKLTSLLLDVFLE